MRTWLETGTHALTVLLIVLLGTHSQDSIAGEVYLRNGLVIDGRSHWIQSLDTSAQRGAGEIPTFTVLLIDSGYKRYFVHRRRVADINPDAELSRLEKFELPKVNRGRRKMLRQVGQYVSVTPFTKFGRRTVTLMTPNGPKPFIQSITEIGPKYLKVSALKQLWQHGLATTSIEPNILDAMIRQVADADKPEDRLAIARFYSQAEMYLRAERELESIAAEFTELTERVQVMLVGVRQLMTQQLLTELKHRKQAGQHQLVYSALQVFPAEKASTSVLRELRELMAEYDDARERGDLILALLGDLQAQLSNKQRVQSVAPMRSAIREQLDHATLERMAAFMNLEGDKSLSPDEKLALAYSGWILGTANAITDLEQSIRIWDARFLVMEYLKTVDPLERKSILVKIQNLEGVGAKTILQLIPQLPPVLETPNLESGKAIEIVVQQAAPTDQADQDSNPQPAVRYSVLLPQEYHHHHSYPMIVALHGAGRTPTDELEWWGGTQEKPLQSQRHGYIVIAPEYADGNQRTYDYSSDAHYILMQSIRDARKRFHVDSNRVFLAGHGMGGDAAFDIGMTHPDVFAGVMPITGVSDKYCKYYLSNAEQLPWYVVGGELDRDTFARNLRDLSRMIRHGYDIVYAEYKGRGYETYYEEIHNLFRWMSLHQRRGLPRDFEVRILRPADDRFYWVKVDELPKHINQAGLTDDTRQRVRAMKIDAHVSEGNTLQVVSGAGKTTVWLSPEFVDFDKRVKIRINRRQRFNDFLEPNLQDLLEDLRIRGDRQRLFWVKKEF